MKNKLNNYFDKKGLSTWGVIMGGIIAVVIVILVLIWFKGGGEKIFGFLGSNVDSLKDCDKDNVNDALSDKCKCLPGEEGSLYDGCPEDVKTKENLAAKVKACDKAAYEKLCEAS